MRFTCLRPMLRTKDLEGTLEFSTEVWDSRARDTARLMAGLWEAVKDHARICYPIEDFHYGRREFAIFDNNRYLLQFGQPLLAHKDTAS